METQKHVKNTQTRTASEEKTTKTKKIPRKPPETHLIFSKTHNPHPFTLRKTRTQQNPMETPKHVKNTPKKKRITPKNERKPQKPLIHPKVPVNLPDVLQNPQFTLF